MQVGFKSGRLSTEDLVFLIRRDKKKLDRVRDLIRMKKEVQSLRKNLDGPDMWDSECNIVYFNLDPSALTKFDDIRPIEDTWLMEPRPAGRPDRSRLHECDSNANASLVTYQSQDSTRDRFSSTIRFRLFPVATSCAMDVSARVRDTINTPTEFRSL
jgi:hypothetical protein